MSADLNRSARLDALRRREAEGALTAAESDELASIYAQMDAEEMEALRPALERSQREQAEMRAETARLAAEAVQLERIAAEFTHLLADARAYLLEHRRRRAALAEEYCRITGRELATPR